MKLKLSAFAGTISLGLAACAGAATQPGQMVGNTDGASDLTPYPAATAGQLRHVIRLPALSDEGTAKLELIVGKTTQVDCNHRVYGGQLQERTAEGWGYNYYVLDSLGEAVSTLMGCPDSSRQTAFVRTGSETLIRYNSKQPVVVYTPRDVELRYRVWRSGDEQTAK